MFVVQTTSISGWQDAWKCKEITEAQEYISELVQKDKISAENYRIIKPIMHCKTRIDFIFDSPEEKPEEKINKEEKVIWAKNQTPKRYNDEELKLLYFERSCELRHWAKTSDFLSADEKYPPWHTYQNYIGSKSNILDMIVHELNKDQVPAKYQKIIDQYYPRRSAEYVIKKLNEG